MYSVVRSTFIIYDNTELETRAATVCLDQKFFVVLFVLFREI